MWFNKIQIAFVLVSFTAVGCGSTDKAKEGGGASGAPAASGTGGAAAAVGTGGAPAAVTGGAPAAAPLITQCGGTMCPDNGMLSLLRPTCCTADMKCGTASMMAPTDCKLPVENTSKCPNEIIAGTMVPGCCMADMTTCGVVDVTGFLGGGCNTRCMAALLAPTILPASCSDGVPMGECPKPAGTGGMGTGGTGTGGMAAAGGTGGT
jgi:hypothetical protein